MKITEKVFGIAAMMAAINPPVIEGGKSDYMPVKSIDAPNGNSRRTHKQNVKRRRLRRLKNKAMQLSK